MGAKGRKSQRDYFFRIYFLPSPPLLTLLTLLDCDRLSVVHLTFFSFILFFLGGRGLSHCGA